MAALAARHTGVVLGLLALTFEDARDLLGTLPGFLQGAEGLLPLRLPGP